MSMSGFSPFTGKVKWPSPNKSQRSSQAGAACGKDGKWHIGDEVGV